MAIPGRSSPDQVSVPFISDPMKTTKIFARLNEMQCLASPTSITPPDWALIVIDCQNAFADTIKPIENNISRLIRHACDVGAAVLYTQHGFSNGDTCDGAFAYRALRKEKYNTGCDWLKVGSDAWQLVASVQSILPDDAVQIRKHMYSAFHHTELASWLHRCKAQKVVLCGVDANVCVQQTAFDAFAANFRVAVVSDAVHAEQKGQTTASLTTIDQAVGEVVTTAQVEKFE